MKNLKFYPLILAILLSAADVSGTMIGTAIGKSGHVLSPAFVPLTSLQTLRVGRSWAEVDSLVKVTGTWQSIRDSIEADVPPDIEPILLFGFWHPDKMDKPPGAVYTDTYKAQDLNEFRDFCYNLAEVLRGTVRYFVLHNEPNLFWSAESGSVNWRNTIQEFADQCKVAAQAIKEANPDAYIIYGSFAGSIYHVNGHLDLTKKAFVDAIAPEGGTDPIIDAVDCHMYGGTGSIAFYSILADSISAFCHRYDIDWIIGETAGPKIIFPLDSLCPHNPHYTILETLIEARRAGHSLYELKDSLESFTRYYDPDNPYLPENWVVGESLKIENFINKVQGFGRPDVLFGPAKIITWFAALIQPEPNWYGNPLANPEYAEGSIKAFLMHEECYLLNIVYVDSNDVEHATNFSNMVKYIIDNYFSAITDEATIHGVDPLPNDFGLSQNYPNPFNAQTVINYYLPKTSEIRLDIYNLLGQKEQTLWTGLQDAGKHALVWDARSRSSGVYFYKLRAGDVELTRHLLLIK